MEREELLCRFPAYRDKLVAALTRLVGSTEAQDLANETLLRVSCSSKGRTEPVSHRSQSC